MDPTATAPPPPPPPPTGPPASPVRRLRRDREHRVLGGVAAGIARTYGVDVTLVRVLWVVAAFLWIGIPAYVVAWIAIPAGDQPEPPDRDRRRDLGLLVALALVGIGALILTSHLLHGLYGARFGVPFLLIVAGIAILLLRRPAVDARTEDAARAPEAPTVPSPPATEADVDEATPVDVATTETELDAANATESAWSQTASWPATPDSRRQWRTARRARRPRPFLTPIALSVLLIGTGVTTLLQASGAVDVNLSIALAIATCFVGGVLVLSTWIGRARGLIFVGIVLAAATVVSVAIDVPLRGGFGHETHRPTQLADVQPHYELAAGHLELDFRAVSFGTTTTNVAATVSMGRLEVDVPSSVRLEIDTHAGAGAVTLFGHTTSGWDYDHHRTVASDSSGVLHLDLRVGAGEIDVHRFEPNGYETLIGEAA